MIPAPGLAMGLALESLITPTPVFHGLWTIPSAASVSAQGMLTMGRLRSVFGE